MADAKASRRYARALELLAVEQRAEEAVLAEVLRFVHVLQHESPELRNMLRSPVFSAAERLAVLDAVLPRLQIGGVTALFLRFLSDRGRMSLVEEIARQYSDAMDVRAGRVRVHVSTTDPLTPQLEALLRDTFQRATGKQVLLEAKIDASLIGGLVARVGDKVYDASLKTRLEDIKRRLIRAPADAPAQPPAAAEA
jgi:F-type H+-transporting ATPase subunit delta